MPGVISISAGAQPRPGPLKQATWRLLELAQPGRPVTPLGVLLLDPVADDLHFRLREASAFPALEEQEIDLLDALPSDLESKNRTMGGRWTLDSLDEFSGFLRTSDCAEITCRGSAARTADRLFDEHVDREIRPFVSHVPVFALRAAATKFGESMDANPDAESGEWMRVPPGTRLEPGMFVAQVVGRSMEPLIPDGSLCLFRAKVTGSRQGRRLLIEQFDETDFAARYTVKKYTSVKRRSASSSEFDDEWEHERIRLEPLNREFPAFDLAPDQFRVIGEFISVLD